jgi:hypothetical protein
MTERDFLNVAASAAGAGDRESLHHLQSPSNDSSSTYRSGFIGG